MKIIKRLAIGLLAGLLLLAMAGCSNKETDSRTPGSLHQGLRGRGAFRGGRHRASVRRRRRHRGTMFKIGDETVKIYMYESEEALEKAQKDYASTVKDFKRNGRFLLETTNQKAQDIFNKVEKAK